MRDVDGVDQFRFIQERLDQFVLQLAIWKHPGEETLAEVRKQCLEYLSEPVSLDVQIVDRLPEEKGKFRKFISKVKQPDSTDSQGRERSARSIRNRTGRAANTRPRFGGLCVCVIHLR